MRLEDEILRSAASSQVFFEETLDVIVCLHKTSCEQLCNSVSIKKPQYVIVKQIGSQSKLTLIRQNKCSFYKRRSVFRISFSNFKQIELFYYLSFHCSWCCPISAKTGESSLLLYDLLPSFTSYTFQIWEWQYHCLFANCEHHLPAS